MSEYWGYHLILDCKGGKKFTKNPKEAAYWFEQAAEQGNAAAQYSLAALYFSGEGVLKSLKDAAYWLKKVINNETAEPHISALAEDAWYKYELWKYE